MNFDITLFIYAIVGIPVSLVVGIIVGLLISNAQILRMRNLCDVMQQNYARLVNNSNKFNEDIINKIVFLRSGNLLIPPSETEPLQSYKRDDETEYELERAKIFSGDA